MAKIFGDSWGHFDILHFQVKAAVATFGLTFGNIRPLFGHLLSSQRIKVVFNT